MARVTSQGSAYARFRRSLDNRSVTNALACAAELKPLGLTDSLELLLLIREKSPERFGRAALRWHGRYCREVNVELEEAQAILATLAALAGERKRNAAFALAELLSRRGLERPCEVLVAWARGSAA
jgi:hypothetical protein